jgi:ubiquinone/menaquinone biosynthesis C-methylase UbiE/DNA-binding transcriptional ArsR family regulator
MNTTRIFGRLAALGDPTRSRLLTLLDGRELTVSELCRATQLPQSTVSRHLGILSGDGWVASRAEGNLRHYRLSGELAPDAAGLWSLVRSQIEGADGWPEDRERLMAVLAERLDRSRAFFSASAERWDELRAELYGARADQLPLFGLLDPTWVVGDLGGGTGMMSLALAPFVERVILVDRSPEMLGRARRRLAGVDNVKVRAGELEALPIADGELDLAVATLVLHHVPDPARVLAEVARVLRPGGRLIVVDMRPHARDGYREEMGHLWPGFEPERLRAWLEDAGLGAVTLRPLAPDPEAKGPLLFVASARAPAEARKRAGRTRRTAAR